MIAGRFSRFARTCVQWDSFLCWPWGLRNRFVCRTFLHWFSWVGCLTVVVSIHLSLPLSEPVFGVPPLFKNTSQTQIRSLARCLDRANVRWAQVVEARVRLFCAEQDHCKQTCGNARNGGQKSQVEEQETLQPQLKSRETWTENNEEIAIKIKLVGERGCFHTNSGSAFPTKRSAWEVQFFFSQGAAAFRRKPQKTADWRLSPSVCPLTCGPTNSDATGSRVLRVEWDFQWKSHGAKRNPLGLQIQAQGLHHKSSPKKKNTVGTWPSNLFACDEQQGYHCQPCCCDCCLLRDQFGCLRAMFVAWAKYWTSWWNQCCYVVRLQILVLCTVDCTTIA